MEINFHPPAEHWGSPIYMTGAHQNPYENLDEISGCNDDDPLIAQIGQTTRESQNRMLAVTLIIPGESASPEKVFRFLQRQMPLRAPNKEDGFFVTDQQGQTLYMGSAELIERTGILQMLGGTSNEVATKLAARKIILNGLERAHLQTEQEILDTPGTKPLFIEMGAGTDLDRITSLRDFALTRGGRLICHDMTPACARAIEQKVEGVPYLALPHRHEFLAPVLAANHAGPKIISMQNVVSSMSFGMIEEIAKVAQLSGVDRITYSQSLTLANASNMLPEGFRPGEPHFEKFIMDQIIQNGLARTMPELMRIGPVVSSQVRHTIEMIIMEIARMAFQTDAEACKFPHHRTSLVEQSTDIPPEKVSAYLEAVKFHPNIEMLFRKGAINTVFIGPFGQGFIKEDGVPAGHLRIKSSRYTQEASTKPLPTPQITPKPGEKVTLIRDTEFLTPQPYRFINITDLTENVLPGNPYTPPIGSINPSWIHFGAQLGYDIIFKYLATAIPYCDLIRVSEKRFYQVFVQSQKESARTSQGRKNKKHRR